MRRVVALPIVAACVAAFPVRSTAQDGRDATLASCAEGAVRALERDGATRVASETFFLVEEETRVVSLELTEGGCYGFLALGAREAQDVDLALFGETGLVLVEDRRVEPQAFVRFCGAPGLRVGAAVRMYRGRGEVRFAAVHGRVTDAPRLDEGARGCFGQNPGRLRPDTDIGPEPVSERGFDASIAREVEAMRQAGYVTREPLRRSLGRRESSVETVEARPGSCLSIVALGGPTAEDVDLTVRDPDGSIRARDAERSRDARTEVCVDAGTRFDVETRMYEGQGGWALVIGEMARPATIPVGLEGDAIARFVAATRALRDRGFETGEGRWVALSAGESIALRVTDRPAGCFAAVAVPAAETLSGRIDLRLLDGIGRVVAEDVGRAGTPIVYACPEAASDFRIEASLYGAAGRIWLMTTKRTP